MLRIPKCQCRQYSKSNEPDYSSQQLHWWRIMGAWFYVVCSFLLMMGVREVLFTWKGRAWKVHVYSLRRCHYVCSSSTAEAEDSFLLAGDGFGDTARYPQWPELWQMPTPPPSFPMAAPSAAFTRKGCWPLYFVSFSFSFNLQHASQTRGLTDRHVPDMLNLQQGPSICISYPFVGDAASALLRAPLWEPLPYSFSSHWLEWKQQKSIKFREMASLSSAISPWPAAAVSQGGGKWFFYHS